MYVILTGGPDTGFTTYGVFDSDTEAVQYAVDYLEQQWWLMPVNSVTAHEPQKGKSRGSKSSGKNR